MDSRKLQEGNALPTIEDEIRKALATVGYIRECNSVDLFKINWSRSSRTDKGVHANRIVFSLKIELPIHDLGIVNMNTLGEDDPPRYPDVIMTLNQVLPKDIRCFSCMKVNQGFVARDACHWRGYEYYMPVEMLRASTTATTVSDGSFNPEEAVKQLNVYLKQMEGCHSFHNFHRLSAKELSGGGKKQKSKKLKRELYSITESGEQDNKVSPVVVNDEGVEEEEEEEIVEEDTSSIKWTSEQIMNINGDHWQAVPREMHFRTKGTIYVCEAKLIKIENKDMVKVDIVGQFFLLQ